MLKRKSKVGAMFVALTFICSSFMSTAFAYDKTYTTYMAGNGHIDTAWKWTTSQSRSSYVPTTYNNAVNLMNSNADYSFIGTGAVHFKWIKEDNATLWNSIKTKVANGQLDIVGGQWIEPDINVPSGENLVRQSLYAQRFYQQEFGKKSTVGFLPDTFGYTGQLPQILKKSGMDYFVFTKVNWNDTNKFPNNNGGYPFEIFRWNGIDGSQVISYKPRISYYSGVNQSDIGYALDETNRHGIKKALYLYGAGDAGGGPTQTQINAIRTADATANQPAAKMYTVTKYFNDLTATDKTNITDTWTGEMYLENHRGVYTSQAMIKKNNRLGEIAAEEAEKLSVMAEYHGTVGYPMANLTNAWEKILMNDFHDILPGTGNSAEVQEALANGQYAIDSFNSTIQSAAAGIASKVDTTVSSGVPIVVFNPLSIGSKQPVETSVTFPSAPTTVKVYDNGTEVPSQVLSISGNTAKIVFMTTNSMPHIGYRVYNAVPNTGNYTGSTGLSIGSNKIISDLFEVTINPTTGNISSILDKTNSKQVFTGGEGNVLQILGDTPTTNYPAWDYQYDDATAAPLSTMNTTTGISIVDNGPVKCTYRVNKSYGSSTFSQYITLYPILNRVDVRMTVDWHETQKMLKVAFPFNVSGATSATYEIAYGAQVRSNQRDTDFNKARFEVPAHKWGDLSNGGYGVSLLNNCKYGYDTYQNTMRLSLLRSQSIPTSANTGGPIMDQGANEFTYSLYPHSGDWQSANTVYKAYEMNYPMIAYQTTSHTGSLGKTYSFMSVNASNVLISAVKKAEDGSNNMIVRMYETKGASSTGATITLPGTISSIAETNLLEENTGTPSYSGNTFSTTFGPYEIKTFKVNCGGSAASATPSSYDLAVGKTATASGNVSGQEPKKALDESTSSKWCTQNAGDKWLRVDLGATATINRWLVKHAGAGGEGTNWNTKNFKLQKSSDGTNWTDVDTVTNNTANTTNRTVTPFTARYVRLYITTPTQDTTTYARIYDFEVYGTGGATGTATFYKDSNYGGTAVTLTPGNYTMAQLNAAGILNDDITSLKVNGGLTVKLYWDDNFGGAELTKTADDASLVDDGWNDKATSLKIY